MSDYTPVNDFSAKDSLGTGEAEKLILGSDMDAETAAIQTAVNTKFDSGDFASQAEAEAGTNTAKVMNPLRAEQHLAAYLAEGAAMVADLKALADPGGDRVYFWDDSDNALEFLTLGNGLAITTNDLAWSASGITGHDTFTDFVSDEHVAHGGVSIVAGDGLTGGGTIASSRTLTVVSGNAGIVANANDITLAAATTSLSAGVELATAGETQIGTDTTRALTADGLANHLVSFIWSGTTRQGGNAFTSGWTITNPATGKYTVTHGLTLADIDDLVMVFGQERPTNGDTSVQIINKTTTTFELWCFTAASLANITGRGTLIGVYAPV